MRESKSKSKRRVVARMSSAMAVAVALGIAAPVAQAQSKLSPTDQQVATSGWMEDPFISQARVGYVSRASYFQRDNQGDQSPQKAGAFLAEGAGFGGWIYGTTGELFNTLSFGTTYNFVLPFITPNDVTTNTALLYWPDQDKAVSVFGELYAKLRFGNHEVKLGRQEINNSWFMTDVVRFYNTIDGAMVGRYDIRGMQPVHYEAATVKGRLLDEQMRYWAGYIWDVRANNSNDFIAYGKYAGTGEDTSGIAYAGLQFKPTKDSMLEGSYYAFKDMYDMVYLQGENVFRWDDKKYVRAAAQYFWQGGNGDNFATGGRDFSTNSFALYTEARFIPHVIPYASIGWTDSEQQIRSIVAIGPHYATQRVAAMPLAGETTLFGGLLFDLGEFGLLKGLNLDLAYAHRTDRQYDFNGPAAPDWDEFSVDLIWINPNDGFFKNTRVRLRWAKVVESGGYTSSAGTTKLDGDRDMYDSRVDFSLAIPFK